MTAKTMACEKCDGKGHIKGFDHVIGGICFRCDGKGSVPARKPAKDKYADVRVPYHLSLENAKEMRLREIQDRFPGVFDIISYEDIAALAGGSAQIKPTLEKYGL